MSTTRKLVLTLVGVLLLVVVAAWYYFFGPNLVASAKLVPGDTVIFATIPNAASLATGYETSQLKKLVNAPEAQPLFDEIEHLVGDKNLALLRVLLPDLSGQSFLALTHFDPSKPGETGFVAAMHPKPGTDHLDSFISQVNAAYPDLARDTKTGRDKLMGLDYQWIEGNNSPGRICVARYHGWIVTTWGEASLQDWFERMQGKSSTPSLAENADYQKSLDRVGKESQAILYLDYKHVLQLWTDHLTQTNPALAAQMQKRLAGFGGAAVGTSFDGGEIVDRFSVLEPRDVQLASGLAATPCAFDTLKFTGADTRFYFGASVNWQQLWKNFQEQGSAQPPAISGLLSRLQVWAQSENIDVQKNIIDALGSEYALQIEWPPDAPWPDLGIFVKVDKPDDFKPAIAAFIDSIRRQFSTTAVITELNADGHRFATLQMVRPMPVSPTITEDGPYFGFFLNQTHAVRSMARDESRGLLHNDAFNRQIGDSRQGATELVFLDTPKFLDQTYRTAMPYLSMGAMFNPTIASLIKGRQLPPDLTWLEPMGPWSAVLKADDDGLTGFSRSGLGNQGIFLGGGVGGAVVGLQMAGFLPHQAPSRLTTPIPGGVVAPPMAPTMPGGPGSLPPGSSVPSGGTLAPAAPLAPVVPPAPMPPAVPAVPPSPSDANSVPPHAPAGTH